MRWRSTWNICSNSRILTRTWRTKKKRGHKKWNKERELRYKKQADKLSKNEQTKLKNINNDEKESR